MLTFTPDSVKMQFPRCQNPVNRAACYPDWRSISPVTGTALDQSISHTLCSRLCHCSFSPGYGFALLFSSDCDSEITWQQRSPGARSASFADGQPKISADAGAGPVFIDFPGIFGSVLDVLSVKSNVLLGKIGLHLPLSCCAGIFPGILSALIITWYLRFLQGHPDGQVWKHLKSLVRRNPPTADLCP